MTAHLYSVEVLEEWKADREGASAEALMGLTNLTEERLGQMLAEAQGQFLDELRPALAAFSLQAPQLPGLLSVLVDELADPRIHGFGFHPDVLEGFALAAAPSGVWTRTHGCCGVLPNVQGLG